MGVHVATGTIPDGGYRLTAARRLALIALAIVTTGTWLLAAPASVWAADPWIREVRFTGVVDTTEPEPMWTMPPMTAETSGGTACNSENHYGTTFGAYAPGGVTTYQTSHMFDADDGTQYHSGTAANSGFEVIWRGDDDFLGEPKTHFRAVTANMSIITLYYWEDDEPGWLPVTTFASTATAAESYDTGIVDIRPGGGKLLSNVIPDDADCFKLRQTTNTADPCCGVTVYTIMLYSSQSTEIGPGGACDGVPGAGGDDGLVIPAAGLTIASDHDQWGDVHLPELDACAFTSDGLYRYYPPEGVDEGETHTVGVEVSSSDDTACRVLIQWAGGGNAVNIINLNYAGANPGGATGPGARIVNTNAPPGADHFNIYFGAQCRLYGLYLGNIEGDPLLDDGSDGTGGPGPDGDGDAWDDCQPGSDFLAVGEWVAYAACLIAGLPIAIANLIGGILTDLFVPTNIGARWAAFLALAETRAPFGWFAQVVDVIEDSAGASADALGAFDLTVGSATVSIGAGIQSALTGVSPYRGLIFAGVALTMVLGCLHWIMAAVGVSPSKPAGGEGS